MRGPNELGKWMQEAELEAIKKNSWKLIKDTAAEEDVYYPVTFKQ